jgi:hypothetical protein
MAFKFEKIMQAVCR